MRVSPSAVSITPWRPARAMFVPWTDVEQTILYTSYQGGAARPHGSGSGTGSGAQALPSGNEQAPFCPVPGIAAGATRRNNGSRLDRERLAAVTTAVAPGISRHRGPLWRGAGLELGVRDRQRLLGSNAAKPGVQAMPNDYVRVTRLRRGPPDPPLWTASDSRVVAVVRARNKTFCCAENGACLTYECRLCTRCRRRLSSFGDHEEAVLA